MQYLKNHPGEDELRQRVVDAHKQYYVSYKMIGKMIGLDDNDQECSTKISHWAVRGQEYLSEYFLVRIDYLLKRLGL